MKNRFKDFIEYYKNLGFTQIFLLLICIALFLVQMKLVHESISKYFDLLSDLVHIITNPEELWILIYCFYPIAVSLAFICQILFKKISKNSLIIDYVVVCTYPIIHIYIGMIMLGTMG